MNDTLLLTDDDITRLNNISGNVDIDKLTPFIYMAQSNKIKRMLGLNLYNKILTEYESDSLNGDYLTIYQYVAEALMYYSSYFYWSIGVYQMDNHGAYKKTVENSQFLEVEEVHRTAKFFEQQGQSVELNFEEWIKDKNIPEYNRNCGGTGNSRGLNWQL